MYIKFLRKVLTHSDVDNNSSAHIVVRSAARTRRFLRYLGRDFVKISDLCSSLVDHCLNARSIKLEFPRSILKINVGNSISKFEISFIRNDSIEFAQRLDVSIFFFSFSFFSFFHGNAIFSQRVRLLGWQRHTCHSIRLSPGALVTPPRSPPVYAHVAILFLYHRTFTVTHRSAALHEPPRFNC